MTDLLPHVNAGLNALAAILLVVGYVLIKRGLETAHKRTMLACFGVSVVFLVCYLAYHELLRQQTGGHGRPFVATNQAVRYFYYTILISHVVLAAAVPFLALATIYYGLRDNRPRHIKLARWTFPIWLYVSITGVVIYVMLYHVAPRMA